MNNERTIHSVAVGEIPPWTEMRCRVCGGGRRNDTERWTKGGYFLLWYAPHLDPRSGDTFHVEEFREWVCCAACSAQGPAAIESWRNLQKVAI